MLSDGNAWELHAACAQSGLPPDTWWPQGEKEAAETAAKVCAGCPVRLACLAQAVSTQTPWGIWGGVWFDGPGRPPSPERKVNKAEYDRRYATAARERRRAQRIEVDGRLVAPLPTGRHGNYCRTQWGCQCDASRQSRAEQRRRARQEAS